MLWGEQDRRTWIRGVWGKSQADICRTRKQSGWLDGARWNAMHHETSSHPTAFQFLYASLKRETRYAIFLGVFDNLLTTKLLPHSSYLIVVGRACAISSGESASLPNDNVLIVKFSFFHVRLSLKIYKIRGCLLFPKRRFRSGR